jgi:hypothetical protein
MDDVSNEEVDAVEFTRVGGGTRLLLVRGEPNKLVAAWGALSAFGTPEDEEEAAKLIAKVAAKAMRRKA